MTPTNFLYLAIATVLSVLFAVVSYASNNQWGGAAVSGGKLFPALSDHLGKVVRIEVQQGEQKLALEKVNALWGVKDRAGYPVEFAKIRPLIVGLSEAKLLEAKTRRPDRYAALDLEDPAAKDSKARLVRLLDEKGQPLAEVVIGKKRLESFGSGKSGTYVRRPGDPQTWLADAELPAPAAAKDWVKTSVVSLDSAKFASVTVEVPGEPPLKIEREGGTPEGKFTFAGFPPDGKKLKDENAADTLARAIASIDLEDVRKLDAPKGDAAGSAKIEGKDQPLVTLTFRNDGDGTWVALTATGEGEAKKAADEITARTKGWEYKIPVFKVTSILKKRAELLEAPPAPAPAPEPADKK
jgi:hypothetical protein